MKFLNKSTLLLGAFLLVALTSMQQLPDILDFFFAHPSRIETTSDRLYSLSLSNLQPGEYYVSLGRPRHFCDIYLNQEIIFKGKTSIIDKRPSLLVGAGFQHNGGDILLRIDCNQFMSGFKQRLSFPPRLYTYTSGMLIHNVRNFIDMAAGPIACLFLLAASFLNLGFKKPEENGIRHFVLIAFSITALVYAISLAHYTRTVLNGMVSSQLHIILRTSFSIAMAALLHPKLFPGKILTTLHAAVCLIVLAAPQVGIDIEQFYRNIFLLYPITTFYTLFSSRHLRPTYDSYFMQALLLSWGAAQMMDWVKQLIGIGYFAAPLYLWAIAAYLIYKVFKEQSSLLKSSAVTKSLDVLINSNLKPSDLIKEVGFIIQSQSCFDSCTIYVDESFVGESNSNGKKLIKVGLVGKSNSPEHLELDEIECPKLSKAFREQSIISGIGDRDRLNYMIIPIGTIGVICLTTTKNLQSYIVGEMQEFLSLLNSSLSLLKEKLERLVSVTGASLSRLRASYGDGTYAKTIGALFIDIADYSKKTEEYGDVYPAFISSTLLPSLIKNVKNLALPEVVRGDEILFILCDDTPETKKNISSAMVELLQKIQLFMMKDAQSLSLSEGFGKVEFRIGFTIGEGTLVVDDVQTRTSGDHINRAKRLQDSAHKGEFLTDADTMSQIHDQNILVLSKKQIVVKKNIIEAVKVGVKRAA